MKKGLLGLIIPLGVITTLILPVGVLYLLLLDPVTSDFVPEDIKTEDVFKRQLVRSFNNTASTGKIEYVVDQNALNQVFYNAMGDMKKEMGEPLSDMIGDIYVGIDGNYYDFYLPIDLYALKTRAKIYTKLTGDDPASDTYVFEITGANIGNLPAWDIVKATGVLNELKLDDAFKDSGLRIKADLPNGKLTYKKSDMMEDLNNLMGDYSGDESGMLSGAFDLMDLTFKFDEGLKGIGDLNALVDDSTKIDSLSRNETLNKAHNEIINPAISAFKSKVKANPSAEQTALSELKEKFGTLQKELGSGKDITTIVTEQFKDGDYQRYAEMGIHGTGGNYEEVAYIDELQIGDVLTATNVLGTNFTFNFKDEIAYAVVDQFFTDLYVDDTNQPYLNLAIGININGYETRAIIQTKFTPASNKFVAEIDYSQGIFYGTKAAPSNFRHSVEEFMDKAISNMVNSGNWDSLEHVPGSTKVRIDFDKMLAKNTKTAAFLTLFDALGERRMVVENDTSNTNSVKGVGKLKIQFKGEGHPVNDISSLLDIYNKVGTEALMSIIEQVIGFDVLKAYVAGSGTVAQLAEQFGFPISWLNEHGVI